jgi:hypothetical protein
MKSHFLLFVLTPLVTFVPWPGTLLAQKPIAEESRHYRLIQVVEASTLEENSMTALAKAINWWAYLR